MTSLWTEGLDVEISSQISSLTVPAPRLHSAISLESTTNPILALTLTALSRVSHLITTKPFYFDNRRHSPCCITKPHTCIYNPRPDLINPLPRVDLIELALMDIIMGPLRLTGSKPARRAYITTFLLASGSLFLLFLAVFSYILFYLNYVPQIGFLQPVYLEYSSTQPPIAHLTLPANAMAPHQPYTVTVHLRLPSSPSNMVSGNFMVQLTLLSATNTTLASSRRPAIMTYRSPLLERIDTLVRAPLLISGWQRQEEILSVVLLEDVVLASRVRTASVSIDAPSSSTIGVYDIAVEFRARFTGVRWLMHNYRITTFLVATALFWSIEVVFMTLVWWGVYSYFAAGGELVPRDDGEEDRREDGGRRRRAGYPSSSPTPGLEEEEERASEELYADDEVSSSDEEVVVNVGDSGLGSTSESAGSTARAKATGEGLQRRRSGAGN